jgi:hypothetical protein
VSAYKCADVGFRRLSRNLTINQRVAANEPETDVNAVGDTVGQKQQ